jgi:hypothetical protein
MAMLVSLKSVPESRAYAAKPSAVKACCAARPAGAGGATHHEMDLPMPPDELIARYISCYNARDIAGMLACVTDDVIFENISNTGQSMRLDGKHMMGQVAELSGNAFSYRRQRLINLVAGSGKAAAEIEFEGKAAVDLPNGAKAGDTVRIKGASFFEFRGGLLSRIADYS